MLISCFSKRTSIDFLLKFSEKFRGYRWKHQLQGQQHHRQPHYESLWNLYRKKEYGRVVSHGEQLVKLKKILDLSSWSLLLRACLKSRNLSSYEYLVKEFKEVRDTKDAALTDSLRGTMIAYASQVGDPVLALSLLKETLKWRTHEGHALSPNLFNLVIEAHLVKYRQDLREDEESCLTYLDQALQVSDLMRALQVEEVPRTYQLLTELRVLNESLNLTDFYASLIKMASFSTDQQNLLGVVLSSYVFIDRLDKAQWVFREFLKLIKNRPVSSCLSTTLREGLCNFLRHVALRGELTSLWDLVDELLIAFSKSFYLLTDSKLIASILVSNYIAMKETSRRQDLEGSLKKQEVQDIHLHQETWLNFLNRATKMGLTLTDEIYDGILINYVFCTRKFPNQFTMDHVQCVLDDMKEQGIVPSIKTCHLLLELYGKMKKEDQLGEGLKIYEKLKSLGWSPTIFTFSLLYALCLPSETRFLHRYSRKIDGRIFELERERKAYRLEHDIASATSLIKVFGRGHLYDEMLGVMAEVDQLRLPKDCMYYNAVFNAWTGASHSAHLGKIKSVWSSMLRDEVRPTLYTVNKYVHSLGNLGDFQSIEDCMVSDMPHFNLEPDVITWNALMKAYLKTGHLRKVEILLMERTMELQSGVSLTMPNPNPATFYQLLNYLSDYSFLCSQGLSLGDTTARFDKTLSYYHQAIRSGCCQDTDPLLLHYLIRAYLHISEIDVAYNLVFSRSSQNVLAGTYRQLIVSHLNVLNSKHSNKTPFPYRDRIKFMTEKLRSLSGTLDLKWLNSLEKRDNDDTDTDEIPLQLDHYG